MKYDNLLQHHSRVGVEAFGTKAAVLLLPILIIFMAGATGCNPTQVELTQREGATQSNVVAEADSTELDGWTLTRLFWQDREEGVVFSGDLIRRAGGYEIQQNIIDGFPILSTDTNDMVQMAVLDGTVVVGVRDKSGGTDKSGWIEIGTGVDEENHGDHSHWHYDAEAKVRSSTLDAEQGNPAHVYRYGKFIYIANDKKNGFTQVRPSKDNDTSNIASAKFFHGGGGHITLAAVGDRVAYSTWIDRKGENAGRIDVVDLRGGQEAPRYSFNLPLGGIHGAAACGNRVFFAASHGVCWVDCDFDFVLNRNTVDVHHLSLDQTPDQTSCRTGAFESFQNHLLCVASGKSSTPALCIIDGTTPSPSVVRIPCNDLEEGMRVSTVRATTTTDNRCWAFAFAEGSGLREKLLYIRT